MSHYCISCSTRWSCVGQWCDCTYCPGCGRQDAFTDIGAGKHQTQFDSRNTPLVFQTD